jgi:hypothetical protein
MDVKQFKNLKENLNDKLYTTFRDLIQGGTIETDIQDNLENLELLIIQETPNGESNLSIIETVFAFDTKSPNNIYAKFNNRTVIRNKENVVMGTFSDYARIDLETMHLIKNKFYEFAIEHELIELDKDLLEQEDAL